MKKVMLVLAIAVFAVACSKETKNKVEVSAAKDVQEVQEAVTHNADVANSILNWKGAKPTGEHWGTIALSEGTLETVNGKLVGGKFTIDMNSIVNSDMPADNEYNAKLVGHLKSADFFDVEKYPSSSFEITDVKEVEGKLHISGNLSIKEATKNITIPATMSEENGVAVLTSETFTVDRTDFDVRYGSKKFFDDLKDKFINDLFEMSFVVKATN